jgi:hypothetical protein
VFDAFGGIDAGPPASIVHFTRPCIGKESLSRSVKERGSGDGDGRARHARLARLIDRSFAELSCAFQRDDCISMMAADGSEWYVSGG